jgi:hypothetical protein
MLCISFSEWFSVEYLPSAPVGRRVDGIDAVCPQVTKTWLIGNMMMTSISGASWQYFGANSGLAFGDAPQSAAPEAHCMWVMLYNIRYT